MYRFPQRKAVVGGSRSSALSRLVPAFAAAVSSAVLSATPVVAQVDFSVLSETAPVERIAATHGFFAGLGSRVAGYPGADLAKEYIQTSFAEI